MSLQFHYYKYVIYSMGVSVTEEWIYRKPLLGGPNLPSNCNVNIEKNN